MHSFLQDTKYSLRLLARTPGFTLALAYIRWLQQHRQMAVHADAGLEGA